MSRRAAGFGFCAIAAFFYGLRYLIAALLFVGMRPGELSTDTLDTYLTYAGDTLLSVSLLALLAGVTYLVWAEIEAWRGRGG